MYPLGLKFSNKKFLWGFFRKTHTTSNSKFKIIFFEFSLEKCTPPRTQNFNNFLWVFFRKMHTTSNSKFQIIFFEFSLEKCIPPRTQNFKYFSFSFLQKNAYPSNSKFQWHDMQVLDISNKNVFEFSLHNPWTQNFKQKFSFSFL